MKQDCDTIVVDAHGVVECFFREFLARVFLDSFYEGRCGKWEIGNFQRGRGLRG